MSGLAKAFEKKVFLKSESFEEYKRRIEVKRVELKQFLEKQKENALYDRFDEVVEKFKQLKGLITECRANKALEDSMPEILLNFEKFEAKSRQLWDYFVTGHKNEILPQVDELRRRLNEFLSHVKELTRHDTLKQEKTNVDLNLEKKTSSETPIKNNSEIEQPCKCEVPDIDPTKGNVQNALAQLQYLKLYPSDDLRRCLQVCFDYYKKSTDEHLGLVSCDVEPDGTSDEEIPINKSIFYS